MEELKELHQEQFKYFDRRCKLLFSDPVILAWILKDSILKINKVPVKVIADNLANNNGGSLELRKMSGLNKESIDIDHGDIVFDFMVVCDLNDKFYIELEGQKDSKKLGYPISKRAAYYLSRLISDQKGNEFINSDYQNLKEAYSIFVTLNGKHKNKIFRQKMEWYDDHGNPTKEEDNPGMMEVIKIYMGEGNKEIGCLKLLELFFFDKREWEAKKKILKEEFEIELDDETEQEVRSMNGFGEGLLEIGYAKGILIGEQKGLLAGEERKLIECIQNLIVNLNLSLSEAMSALNVPSDKREKYESMICNQDTKELGYK